MDLPCNSQYTLMDKVRKEASELRQKGKISSVIISGMRIEYWRAGTGTNTVAFIHGNSSCKEVFHEQLNSLIDVNLSFIAIDLPGHGGSDNAFIPNTNYTIPGYADIIGKFMEKLNIYTYHVVGWSLGGNIAIEMAGQKRPIKSIMIMGAPPIGPGIENVDKAFLPTSLATAGKAKLTNEEIIEFTDTVFSCLKTIPELMYLAADRTDGQAREIMLTHWMGGGPGHNQVHTVQNWEKPISIVHGQDEPFVSLDYLKNTKWKNLWQGKICVIENTGHAPFIERPNPFNNVLSSFIAENI